MSHCQHKERGVSEVLKACPETKKRFWAKVKVGADCWLWAGCKSRKRGYFRFNGKMTKATHIMWLYIYGEFPDKWVLHTCDNPSCVRPDHLYLGTPQDNSNDMVNRKRSPRGIRHGRAKLTNGIVRQIRSYPLSNPKTARVFNISQGQVSKIRNHQQWSHVK